MRKVKMNILYLQLHVMMMLFLEIMTTMHFLDGSKLVRIWNFKKVSIM